MSRPTHCRWCGATLVQAHTGRPRVFCSDLHRKRYRKATAGKVEAFLAELRDDAERRRLRDLQHELVATLASAGRIAHELEGAEDPVALARVTAVRDELGRVLRRHFAGSPS